MDELTEQIRTGCDHYIDVSDRSSLEIAQQIQADGIHNKSPSIPKLDADLTTNT